MAFLLVANPLGTRSTIPGTATVTNGVKTRFACELSLDEHKFQLFEISSLKSLRKWEWNTPRKGVWKREMENQKWLFVSAHDFAFLSRESVMGPFAKSILFREEFKLPKISNESLSDAFHIWVKLFQLVLWKHKKSWNILVMHHISHSAEAWL